MAKHKQQDFEAEMDAGTLGEAAVIQANRQRLGRARKAADRLAKEATTRANGLKKVARTRPAKKAPARKVAKRGGGRKR